MVRMGFDVLLGRMHELKDLSGLVGLATFWRRFFPVLQQHFPHSLSDVTAEGFHGAINRVGPSLIRGHADEVTYNLHIWSSGDLGYFPTYALGNLYAASLFAALRRDVTDLDQRLERGELTVVTRWLREKIHSQGSRHEAEELVRRICGHGLRDDELMGYLKTKYSELCGVAL